MAARARGGGLGPPSRAPATAPLRVPPQVSYLRLDGRVPASKRGALVERFNADPSVDLMLLTTAVGGARDPSQPKLAPART